MEHEKVLLLSIIYQLLDGNPDLSNINPNVQEYLLGLQDEFDTDDPEEARFYEHLYYYADTYFNQIYDKETLH